VQPRCLDASGASGTRPVMMKSTSGQAEVYRLGTLASPPSRYGPLPFAVAVALGRSLRRVSITTITSALHHRH
jgi:hypothetical protein